MRNQEKLKERITQQSDRKKENWFTYSTSAREKEVGNIELFGYVAPPSNQSRNINILAIYIRWIDFHKLLATIHHLGLLYSLDGIHIYKSNGLS